MKILALLALAFVAEARNLGSAKRQASISSSFIIDGAPADIQDFPSQASLRYNNAHTCGCVLMTTTLALTAAHCVDGRLASGFEIYYGSSNRLSGGTLTPATSYRMHEKYGDADGGNAFPWDIALVEAAFTFDGVTAVGGNLPLNTTDFANETCTITGWGRTGFSNDLPEALQQVSNTILSNAVCDERMSPVSGAGVGPYHICISDETDQSSGSCNGDSGGPMHCSEGGVTVIAGITSWGISGGGSCLTDYPSAYTRVSYFLDWLQQPE